MRAESADTVSWTRRCGIGAIAAALPTVIWRVLVGAGATLGTPASWRRSESLPGSGTIYVCTLSAVQLLAALSSIVLFVDGADRIPRFSPIAPGRRLPRRLVLGAASAGTTVLAVLVVLSIVHWHSVDPFHDATRVTGWTILCWVCYAAAILWPPLLGVATVGYARMRRD